jgi:tight adherence protein C
MSASTSWLYAAATVGIVLGVFGSSYILALRAALPRPSMGPRGLKRQRAIHDAGLFYRIEPILRKVAAWLAPLPLGSLRARLEVQLLRSGDWLGLCADEILAMCLLSGIGSGSVVALLTGLESGSLRWVLAVSVFGSLLPSLRLEAVAKRRARRVTAALPSTIDLASLCMSAGLDFPGSIRQIVEHAPDRSEPMIEELGRIVQELELGHTRRRALEHFAERVPSERVRELVYSVVQAEEKGNPIAELLSIQAQTQRLKRSIDLEESAAKAALLLMGPMALISLCVIVLLLGPIVVRFSTGGFGV